MDPYSDKPLVYKKTDNNFILYTPGPSLIDHGGKMTIEFLKYDPQISEIIDRIHD